MLHAHLDQFKDKLGAYSEEQVEPFHQDLMDFEQRYQGQYNENMMGDYIWGLIRESPYKHKKKYSFLFIFYYFTFGCYTNHYS